MVRYCFAVMLLLVRLVLPFLACAQNSPNHKTSRSVWSFDDLNLKWVDEIDWDTGQITATGFGTSDFTRVDGTDRGTKLAEKKAELQALKQWLAMNIGVLASGTESLKDLVYVSEMLIQVSGFLPPRSQLSKQTELVELPDGSVLAVVRIKAPMLQARDILSSPIWQKAPDASSFQILQLVREMLKTRPSVGTKNRNNKPGERK